MNQDKKLVAKTQFNPAKDTGRGKKAAEELIKIVTQNGWSMKIGSNKKEFLVYEAWQTLGKYYEMSVETLDAQPIEIGGIVGFKASAQVIDNKTGLKIGGAEAYCMRDEFNWKSKPVFQLASMAQTRAGSKALRQILGFVVALAGYNPTPLEEMTGNEHKNLISEEKMTAIQKDKIISLAQSKGKTPEDLDRAVSIFKLDRWEDLTKPEADKMIIKLETLEEPINNDEVDKAIS